MIDDTMPTASHVDAWLRSLQVGNTVADEVAEVTPEQWERMRERAAQAPREQWLKMLQDLGAPPQAQKGFQTPDGIQMLQAGESIQYLLVLVDYQGQRGYAPLQVVVPFQGPAKYGLALDLCPLHASPMPLQMEGKVTYEPAGLYVRLAPIECPACSTRVELMLKKEPKSWYSTD